MEKDNTNEVKKLFTKYKFFHKETFNELSKVKDKKLFYYQFELNKIHSTICQNQLHDFDYENQEEEYLYRFGIKLFDKREMMK